MPNVFECVGTCSECFFFVLLLKYYVTFFLLDSYWTIISKLGTLHPNIVNILSRLFEFC